MTLPTIDHIGIIVDDLDKAIEMFEHLFQIKPTKVTELADAGLKIAHLEARNIGIELIQYAGGDEGFGRRVMGPGRGVNHMSIQVEDTDSAVKDLQDKGLRVMEGFPRTGSHGRVAFFEPETTRDILLEICESPG